MFNPIRFVCLGGAALALSACSVPDLGYSERLGQEPAQQAVAPVQAPRATASRVAPSAPAAAPAQVAQQQAEEEVREAPRTNRWAHQRIGLTTNLDDGDETGGWGG